MSDLPDRRILFSVGRRSIVTTPNLRINPQTIDVPGSDVNVMLGSSALQGEEVVAAFAACFRGLFVETARQDQLDRVAFDRYGLTRFPATPALVDLIFSRGAGANPGGTIPAGNVVQTAAGIQFATDVNAVFPASPGVGQTIGPISATCLITGPDGRVPQDSIKQFVDAPFDPTITVFQPNAAAGGNDVEADVAFRARIRDFFKTVRRGTLEAIEFGARQVPGVAVAKGYEVTNPPIQCLCPSLLLGTSTFAGDPLPACAVQLIIADTDGNATSGMITQVEQELVRWRAAGIPVEVFRGVVVFQDVRWDVDTASGFDPNTVQDDIRAGTLAVMQNLRPGETLLRSSLIAIARSTVGAIVRNNSLEIPDHDIDPTVEAVDSQSASKSNVIRGLESRVTFV